jgi:hypothetical protein
MNQKKISNILKKATETFTKQTRAIESNLSDMEIIRTKFNEIEEALCGFLHLYYKTLIGLKRITNIDDQEKAVESCLPVIEGIRNRLGGTCQRLSEILNEIDFNLDLANKDIEKENLDQLPTNKIIEDIQRELEKEDRYKPQQVSTGIMTSRIIMEMLDHQLTHSKRFEDNPKQEHDPAIEEANQESAANNIPPEPSHSDKPESRDMKVPEPEM